ncbi:hypothetical protein [Microbulbifer sp. JMSA003]|uniref:hypothetical protein n=1 Tax=Microbulbifer sp. JMSA003 TaxID=3243369 RepID=UPI004039A399
MVDSIHEPLISARMDDSVGITKSGKQEIAGVYFYMPCGDKEEIQFSVANTFGPLNTISYLRKNSSDRGEGWKILKLEMYPDQTQSLILGDPLKSGARLYGCVARAATVCFDSSCTRR